MSQMEANLVEVEHWRLKLKFFTIITKIMISIRRAFDRLGEEIYSHGKYASRSKLLFFKVTRALMENNP